VRASWRGAGRSRGAGPVGRAELALLQLRDQRIERAVEDLRDVAGGDGVGEQRLRAGELVARGLRDGDLDPDVVGGEVRGAGVRGPRDRCRHGTGGKHGAFAQEAGRQRIAGINRPRGLFESVLRFQLAGGQRIGRSGREIVSNSVGFRCG